jgi:hypothetical protein
VVDGAGNVHDGPYALGDINKRTNCAQILLGYTSAKH